MKVLPFYKDLVLKYAVDAIENQENSDAINKLKEQFVQHIEDLRDRYPELLFVNYSTNLDDEKASVIFKNIKERVKDRYSIKLIPDTLRIDDNVNGDVIETPGIIKMEDGGYICLRYDNLEIKKALLLELFLHIVIQLPIKKIEFTFVDLMGKYDEEYLLKNFNSIIYRNRPVTSESLLEELLSRLEKRQLEVAQKYGDYARYCEQHQTIPMPYEFIIMLDENYNERYHKKLNSIIKTGYKYGVYVVTCEQCNEFLPINCVLDPNGKQFYEYCGANSPNFISDINLSGTFYSVPANDIYTIPKSKEEDNVWRSMPTMNNFIAKGYGDFDVVLTSRMFKTGGADNKVLSIFQEKFGISYDQLLDIETSNSEVVLASFPTEKEANSYITQLRKDYRFPNGFSYPTNCVFIGPCWRDNGIFSTKSYSIALFVPDETLMTLGYYYDDLKFYMELMGVNTELFNHMIKQLDFGNLLIEGSLYLDRYEADVRGSGSFGAFLDSFVNKENYHVYDFSKYNEIMIENDIIAGYPFRGKGVSYWNQINFSNLEECFTYIGELERKVHEQAIKKWGVNYLRKHLSFGWNHNWINTEGCGDYCVAICHRPHETKVIRKYEVPSFKGLVSYTPITSNKSLMKACLNYINREAVAKEERKAISMDYSNSVSSIYVIPDNVISTSIA